MRKLAIVLLCCFIVVGCKNHEPAEIVVQNTDGTTRPLPPPETPPAVVTQSVTTVSSAAPGATQTATAATTSTTTTATSGPGVGGWGKPPTPEEPDMIVDTIYVWPADLIPAIAQRHPQLVYFNTHEAKNWEARRKRQGWTEVTRFNVPGRTAPVIDPKAPPPKRPYDLFIDFPRIMIVYRKN